MYQIAAKKEVKPGRSFDFVKLVRLGAALIVLLAGAYLYFFARRP
jgi:hypothetical protein